MPRPKTLLKNASFTVARASHDCKSNSKHRINKGDLRLTIREDRSNKHYCQECALNFLEKDLESLHKLIEQAKE